MKTSNAETKGRESIIIREEFKPFDRKPLDSKHRITLGGKLMKVVGRHMKVDSYQIFVGKEGDILLRPAVSIPSSEAWVYRNPQVIGKIRKGLEEAGQGETERVKDLEDFLKKL